MDKFLIQHRQNVVLIDIILRINNQGFLKPVRPTSILGWVRHTWPIWYLSIWLTGYMYLIFGHGKKAGLELVSQQIWCAMTVAQVMTKLINGSLQVEKLQDLFKWCEECYTMSYGEYEKVVLELYEKRDKYITMCIRWVKEIHHISRRIYWTQMISAGS